MPLRVWNLEIKMDGEHENCSFLSGEEAASTFEALIADYGERLSRASLVAPDGTVVRFRSRQQKQVLLPEHTGH